MNLANKQYKLFFILFLGKSVFFFITCFMDPLKVDNMNMRQYTSFSTNAFLSKNHQLPKLSNEWYAKCTVDVNVNYVLMKKFGSSPRKSPPSDSKNFLTNHEMMDYSFNRRLIGTQSRERNDGRGQIKKFVHTHIVSIFAFRYFPRLPMIRT